MPPASTAITGAVFDAAVSSNASSASMAALAGRGTEHLDMLFAKRFEQECRVSYAIEKTIVFLHRLIRIDDADTSTRNARE